MFWYPRYAENKMRPVLESDWGRLFANWGKVQPDAQGKGYPDVGAACPELTRSGIAQFKEAVRLIGMAIRESPELQLKKRAGTAYFTNHG
jgi:hypothetical protein